VENCNLDTCQRLFLISKNSAAVDILLNFRVTWSASLKHSSVVLWLVRKRNWRSLSKFLSLICTPRTARNAHVHVMKGQTLHATLRSGVPNTGNRDFRVNKQGWSAVQGTPLMSSETGFEHTLQLKHRWWTNTTLYTVFVEMLYYNDKGSFP
jgi:hypothetical protein